MEGGNEPGEKTRALGQGKEKKKKNLAEKNDCFCLKKVKHVVFQNSTKQMRPCGLFKGKQKKDIQNLTHIYRIQMSWRKQNYFPGLR